MLKLINALDLQHWADTKESEVLMPELMRRLVHASMKGITHISFPNEDSVNLPGFDGILETTDKNEYVSEGFSVFEIGTNKSQKTKADSDYNKRTKGTAASERKNLNFVFVTPRNWSAARKWESAKKRERKWKSVRVLTAVELEDWLSLCPSVSVWLLSILKHNFDIRIESVEDFWEKWSINEDGMKLNYMLLLGGREKEETELLQNLSSPGSISIVSNSTDESLAFIVASILNSNNQELIDRCIIAYDEKSVIELLKEYNDIIIVTCCKVDNYGGYTMNNNNCVIFASNYTDKNPYENKIKLPGHDYYKFQQSLMESGLSETTASRVAIDSGRSVSVLRHQLKFVATKPKWTQREDLKKVIPVMLLGRWVDTLDGDKKLIGELTGEKYEDISPLLLEWLNIDDGPFGYYNHCWYVLSPYDTFLYINEFVTDDCFKRFACVLKETLADLDSNATDLLNPNSFVYSVGKRQYSGQTRDGLCLTLILRALLDNKRQGQGQVDVIVKDIFETSDLNWWLTYRHGDVVSYLAEASPKAFIEYIEKDLRKDKPLMQHLFVPIKKNHFLASEYEVAYTHILFALEMLAWMPEYLIRVSLILAQLAKIPNESNYGNKPINSLVDIYRLWLPMTSVDSENRCKAIRRICKSYPEVGLDLCFRLAKKYDQQHISYSPRVSRWRLKEVVVRKTVTYGEIYAVLKCICEIIVDHGVPTSAEASEIMEIATYCSVFVDLRKMLREYLIEQHDMLKDDKTFYKHLMNNINHFRCYPNARWSLPEPELREWEALLDDLRPTNLQDQLEHVFDGNYHQLPELRGISDYEEKFKKVEEFRFDAVDRLLKQDGFEALMDYSRRLTNPQYIMRALAVRNDALDYFDHIYKLAETDEFFRKITVEFFGRLIISDRKGFLEKINANKGHCFIWFPLASVWCTEDDIWKIVDSLPEQQQHEYWTHSEVHVIPCKRVEYLNHHYECAGRGDQVVKILYHVLENKNQYPLDLDYVVNIMKRVLPNIGPDQLSLIHFELNMVMEWIDKQTEISASDIVTLEIPYILMTGEDVNAWRIYKMIIENPYYMFEMIDYAFYSDNPQIRKQEEKLNCNDKQRKVWAKFSGKMLFSLHTMPCMKEDGTIDEERLKDYIATMRRLGGEKEKMSMVNHTIGQLLANHPACINGCPPDIICEIIEELNNKVVNDSFHAQIYNRLGATVRGPYDGGGIEHNRTKRFCETSEKLQILYPITAEIYRDLGAVYSNEAQRHDTETEIMKLDN